MLECEDQSQTSKRLDSTTSYRPNGHFIAVRKPTSTTQKGERDATVPLFFRLPHYLTMLYYWLMKLRRPYGAGMPSSKFRGKHPGRIFRNFVPCNAL
jgi:hypothetical protein